MTTIELIDRGIGHNCLSDAYDLGKAEAVDKFAEAMCELSNKRRMHDIYADDIESVADRIKHEFD